MPVPTLDAAMADYLANLHYATNGSVAECQLFIAACAALLVLLPADHNHGPTRFRHDVNLQLIQKQERFARAWLALQNSGLDCDPNLNVDWR